MFASITTRILTLVPMDYTDGKATRPPGLEKLDTLITWGLWVVGFILFCFFLSGLVSAGKARHNGGQVDASAPVWPLVLAIVAGAAGTIWRVIVS